MYDFNKEEKKILDFWQANQIFKKSLALTEDGEKFVFFEGPPTANGKPGIHHILSRQFKDIFCRYKTMQGFFVLRKAGWDTHGLPVEIEVEKELGFKSKKDIENYGIDKFNQKCRESVWRYKGDWEKMTERMGYWVDMHNPYITYLNEYMESIWWIMRQIWDKDLLYKAHRVVPFCVRCGTPLSSHEVAQGYKLVKERSVYLKFKVKNYAEFDLPVNTYVLAWTTTPWTLPGNIALAVGKNIDYSLVRKDGQDLILASELVEKVLGQPYELVKEFKGKDLVGIEYEPLFDIPELKSEKSYKIYDADFVSTTDGTGVVHTAVMYGEDDYQLGVKIGLPKIHTVNEQGKFKENVGNDLVGLYVKDKATEDLIVEKLKASGTLLKTQDYEHDYPFCWRCDSPLLYYAKDSWFIKMSAVNKQLLENNGKINWYPEHVKEGRFGQWLKEGKDWSISRERYWATPLPIWECIECGEREVVESVAELEKKSIGSGNAYYILRHGLSERKEKTDMIIGCHLDADKYHLTEEGRGEAQAAAEEIKKLGGVDYIFSSPFLRTKETAEIVSKETGTEVIEDSRLREVEWGPQTEGRSLNEFPNYKGKDFDYKHYDGESWNDERKRITEFMKELEEKYQNKKILIVSHGDPLRMIKAAAVGMTEDEIFKGGSDMEPRWGELYKLEWRNIPRNNLGALDLHRPYIDKTELKCKCGKKMKRIPEVIDVWFDSGSMPFSQWHWPFENEKIFKDQYPAGFIAEAMDQTRGWFYTLLAIATLLGKGQPYENVICLAHVLDGEGKKMSKSKGNVIYPMEAMEKNGADPIRWYFFTVNGPGEYKLFSFKDLQMRTQGFFSTLQNCLRFYKLYETSGEKQEAKENLLDKWMVSKMNGLIKQVSEDLDNYQTLSASRAIEKFLIEDLSNWWLRRSRKREGALLMLRDLLLEISKLSAPFIPFMAESMFQDLAPEMDNRSVHLQAWPKFNSELIDEKLETEMDEVRNVVTAGLALRKENQTKVRQPLRAAIISRNKAFDADLEDLIKDELNVKELEYVKSDKQVELDFELSQALKDEGYARELMRQIQDMRKEAGYKLNEEVFAQWHSDDAGLTETINRWSDSIKKDTLLKEFKNQPNQSQVFDVEKSSELAPGKNIWLGVRK